MPDTQPRVFVSYSRADEATAIEIVEWLEANDLPCWRDRNEMRAGRDWWQQIVDALKVVEYMVLLATPHSMSSPVVEREWRQARQEGVCVLPIMLPDNPPDFAAMPKWMRDVDFFDYKKGDRTHFIAQLQARCEIARVPFMAPALPEHFVQRPDQYHALKTLLIDRERGEPIAVTTALQGGGGFGKTTLAAALCHDTQIQEVFDDGVLWVTLGEEPDVLGAINGLLTSLTGTRTAYTTVEAAKTALREALDRRDCLLVIDDAWKSPHVEPFLLGNQTAHLITTRQLDVVVGAGATISNVEVNEMGDDEALQLLLSRLTPPPQDIAACRALAARLGEWPLLLEIANGWLRKQAARGRTGDDALQALHDRLDKKGMAKVLVRRDEAVRKRSAADTVAISLDALEDDALCKACYLLGIFAEDTDIPLTSIAALWGMDDIDTEDRVETLHDASLLRYDPDAASVRLHDVVRQVLLEHVPDKQALHRQLVGAWGALTALPDPYAWTYIAYHMTRAGMETDLANLLLDFDWLQAKLNATDVNALLEDLNTFDTTAFDTQTATTLTLVKRAVLKSAHVLDDASQFAAQLVGRLAMQTHPKPGHGPRLDADKRLTHLIATAKDYHGLLPVGASLTPAQDALVRTIETTGRVNAVCEMPNGQIVAAEHSDSIRVWDSRTWAERWQLEGHRKTINALAVLDATHIVSASDDHSLRIWNIESGTEVRRLYGHDSRVLSVLVVGGQIVSGGGDNTIRVWSGEVGPELLPAEKGGELHILRGHTDDVNDLALAPDGSVWSVSVDGTLRQWDINTGVLVRRIETPHLRPAGLAIAPSGGIFIYGRHTEQEHSEVRYIHPQRADSPDLVGTAEGWLLDIITLSDTVAITGSTNRDIHIWHRRPPASHPEPPQRQQHQKLKGHMGSTNALHLLANGTLLTGASDATLRIWDIESVLSLETARRFGAFAKPAHHPPRIYNMALLAENVLCTVTNTGSIGVWQIDMAQIVLATEAVQGRKAYGVVLNAEAFIMVSGPQIYRFLWQPQHGNIEQLASIRTGNFTAKPLVVDDGRVITGTSHQQWQIWDSNTWDMLATHKGHGGGVGCLAQLNDAEILLGSTNDTISRHDLQSGHNLQVYEGHKGRVNGLAVLDDGRFVSCSADRHICVWQPDSSAPLRRMYAHDGFVNDIAQLHGALVVTGGFDNRVRVWDIDAPHGQELLATYTADAALNCLTVRHSDDLIMAGDSMGRVHWLRYKAERGF